jgi:secreted PhoX family phosphatase
MKRGQWQLAVVGAVGLMVACTADERTLEPRLSVGAASHDNGLSGSGGFQFAPLASSAVCTNGGNANAPFILPAGFDQVAIAHEPDMDDAPDMNTQNENGPQAGRYLYRVSEGSKASLAVTDLVTGVTKIIAARADWESLDPTVWTPWGTLLFAEETNAAARRDPAYPQAVAGLVYEVFFDPADLTHVVNVVARPAIGSKSHEGMRFDTDGNLYSISERTPGYIFKFVPDVKGDLSSGQTYVLRITQVDGDRTGLAEWVALDRAAVQIDASAAADGVKATGYGRPEDVEIATSSGNNRGGPNTLYVAITSEHRVLAIDLKVPGNSGATRVSNYVARGLNTDAAFSMPDNLALDHSGNLYITEDPGGSTSSGKPGDDIWVATPGKGQSTAAASVVRFASLTDCEAEPTGIYFDMAGQRLFVNVQHRGGDRIDKTMAITPSRGK